ncbi:AEC family transporter [Neptuniibacter sp. CAU 1671]|uniref:AEC family transporter n=1 Tax=Neptuniibacter sp. CAU 1671 TaxID=3032593 RepID=UPI0023DA19CE|nr:AEC family transporter [Neptuniibacter sp. CAU 1671]MDF2181330.1 AEC family transporter [Neptuniibacter sp. CAU 1671]
MNLYLDSVFFTANIVAPIFVIVMLGFILRRASIIDDAFVLTASKLVFVVTLPTLVFMSIARTDFHAVFNPDQLLFVLFGTLIFFAALWFFARRFIQRPEDIGVFIQGSFRSNYGIIGLAISYNLYADSGLAQASLLLAIVIPLFNVLSILALTLPHQSTDGRRLSGALREVIRNPLIIAVLLALPVSYLNIELPGIVQSSGKYFANMTLPLALLTIGASLNMDSLKSTSGQAFWATFNKLILMPIGLTIAAYAVGFRGQDLTLLMVLFGCPTAAASFVMAKTMKGNAELAANIILATTLGSVLTLSTGIYLMRLWGVII